MENKTIDLLNKLVEINNDRIEGYETASKETEDSELKSLFSQLAKTSYGCNAELTAEVQQLGGTPVEGTRVTGKFYRAWMDVRAALSGKDRKAILKSCEYGEDVAVKTYEEILEEGPQDLSDMHLAMVEDQYHHIKADHDKVRDLRDATV